MRSVAGAAGLAVVVVTRMLSGETGRPEAIVALDRISVNVVDERGRRPPNAETRIFEARHRRPILAPDGRHLTFGRFLDPQGELTVRCAPQGTVLRFVIGGLIPNGSYSLWSFVFEPPGWTSSMEWAIGAGGLGAASRAPEVFTASISGEAFVVLTVPGGPMSGFGSIRPCALDEFQWMIVGAYNLDRRTPRLLDLQTGGIVEQFGFTIKRQ